MQRGYSWDFMSQKFGIIRTGGSDAGKIIQERAPGPGETPLQLFYGKDMNFGNFGAWMLV
jgi:hypothetical protein